MKKVLMYATAFAMTFAVASCGAGNGEGANDENAIDSTEVVTPDDQAGIDETAPEEESMDNAEDMNDESMDVASNDSIAAADKAEETEAPAAE